MCERTLVGLNEPPRLWSSAPLTQLAEFRPFKPVVRVRSPGGASADREMGTLGPYGLGTQSTTCGDQCRKWRRLVKTMATPAASQASITSASRFEPPGWITAVAPASIAACGPSAK